MMGCVEVACDVASIAMLEVEYLGDCLGPALVDSCHQEMVTLLPRGNVALRSPCSALDQPSNRHQATECLNITWLPHSEPQRSLSFLSPTYAKSIWHPNSRRGQGAIHPSQASAL